MFNRFSSSFKGTPETFSLTLRYAHVDGIDKDGRSVCVLRPRPSCPPRLTPSLLEQTNNSSQESTGGAIIKDTTVVHWLSSESETEIIAKITAAVNDPEIKEERVAVQLRSDGTASSFWGVVSAASAHHDVQLGFHIEAKKPPLASIDLMRDGGAGVISTSLGLSIWSVLDLKHVTRLRCNEGVGSLWDRSLLERFTSLRHLDLSHANLTTLPGVISTLISLQELRLVGNYLKILPPEIGKLTNLRVLALDNNELSILPGELRRCTALEEFTLENNRLTSVLLSFGSLKHLKVLHMSGNPLEFLPEISPCHLLRSLTVANLRVSADQDYKNFDVELLAPVGPSPTISIGLFDSKPTDKLRPIFSLMLRRSSGHHPLLAGAFRYLAEDPKNRDLMAKQENALQQLILMALNDDSVVVEQTCMTLALLAMHSPTLADQILDADAGSMKGILRSDDPVKQIASLELMAAISLSLGDANNRLLSADVISSILRLINDPESSQELQAASLRALGNLGYSPAGKAWLAADARVMDTILRLAEGIPARINNSRGVDRTTSTNNVFVTLRVKAAAIRALAVLGDIPAVTRAVGRRSPPKGRGLRILSMDGGGMKGMATVRLLRELESCTGRPIHSLFDLIVGTSTGGLLAVALGLRKFSLDECDHIYKVLGQRVFSTPTHNKEKDETWMEAFYRTFHSKTQHVRAVVVGYKHDATVYESLLKEYCSFKHDPRCASDTLIDTAALDVPRVSLVSTLASSSPAVPFVFRNYELPISSAKDREAMCYHAGSSKHVVWQAVRASSAAIYYLDDFTCGHDKFQDGAVLANNPGIIALQEARALWPDTPIDVFISIGTGSTPITRRDKGMSSFIDTGNIVIESATNVERVHEALATVTPLMPGVRYYRFNPIDARCAMELDEVNPEKWAILEEATEEFIEKNGEEFAAAAAALLGVENGQVPVGGGGGGATPSAVSAGANEKSTPVLPESQPILLGLHRGVFVCTAVPAAGEPNAAEVAAASCARSVECSASIDLQLDALKHAKKKKKKHNTTVAATTVPSATTTATTVHGHQQPSMSPAIPIQPPPPNVVEVDLGSALGSVFSWFSPSKAQHTNAPALELPASPPATALVPAPTEAATPPPPSSTSRGPTPSPASHPIVVSPGPDTPGTGKYAATKTSSRTEHLQSQTEAMAATVPPAAAAAGKLGGEREYAQLGLEEAIKHAMPPVGILHIALRSCATGFVLQWKENFAAVTVPSEEADEIIRQSGRDPAQVTLAELFELGGGEIDVGSSTVRAVNRQYRRLITGELASVILVQYTSPEMVLTADRIKEMSACLAGKVVLCSDIVPSACLAAFAVAGVLAVVSPEEALSKISGATASALTSFWSVLWGEFTGGEDLAAALQKAEEAQPILDGAFQLHEL